MKVTSFALATLLLAAVWTGAQSDSFISHSSTCCFKDNFVRRSISPKHIRSCRPSGPNCARQAVIVTLTKGKEVCVDSSEIDLKTCKRKQEKILEGTRTARLRQQPATNSA